MMISVADETTNSSDECGVRAVHFGILDLWSRVGLCTWGAFWEFVVLRFLEEEVNEMRAGRPAKVFETMLANAEVDNPMN